MFLIPKLKSGLPTRLFVLLPILLSIIEDTLLSSVVLLDTLMKPPLTVSFKLELMARSIVLVVGIDLVVGLRNMLSFEIADREVAGVTPPLPTAPALISWTSTISGSIKKTILLKVMINFIFERFTAISF
jgi:hypothetical protein